MRFRYVLGATGTHVGCEHGVCGCCTVLLDGTAVRSKALTLAVQAEGRTLETVEALAGPDGSLNALQRAFLGTPRLAMRLLYARHSHVLTDFLARNPNPSEAEVVDVLSGHLPCVHRVCRNRIGGAGSGSRRQAGSGKAP